MSPMVELPKKVVSVALNPTIDRGIEVGGFSIGAHQIGKQVFRRPAGKAINVARVLRTLDIPTFLTGFVGAEERDYFQQDLADGGLSCQWFSVQGRTRENITIIDPVNRVDTHIRERGFTVESSDLSKLCEKLASLCSENVYVCFSGSLPQGIGVDALIELIRVCQKRSAKVCLDCGGDVLRGCKELKLYLIKPNLAELAEMLGLPTESESHVLEAAETIRSMVELALVTCGGDGGYLLSEKANLRGRVGIDPSAVRNTVGCGDAVLGGFLAGMIGGKTLQESYRLALAVATSAATSLNPAEIDIDDVERFCEIAEVETID